MKRGRPLLGSPADDCGAALLMVLIIVTVIGMAGAALLSFSGTSIRTTVALRDQAAAAYAADGAAQVAISQVQNGKLECSSATPTVVTLGIGATRPFYAPNQSQDGPLNASIKCAPDLSEGVTSVSTTTGTGVAINSSNNPTFALLTVGTSDLEDGQDYAGNKTACVSGGSVVSNSTINLGGKGSGNSLSVGLGAGSSDCTVEADPSVKVEAAYGTGCNGLADDTNTGDFPVTPCNHRSSPVNIEEWKGFAPIPVDPLTRTNQKSNCLVSDGTTYAAFLPGYYSDVALLNLPCFGVDKNGKPNQTGADFEWFSPGTYYFDFGDTTWSWPDTLVAGTPMDSTSKVPISTIDANKKETLGSLSKVTSFPGSCADPSTQSVYPGVEFVFGGSSTVTPSSSGKNEICATYSATSPPVAIYGVSSEVVGSNSLDVEGGSVAAQTLCDQETGEVVPCTSSSSGGESLIQSNSNGKNSFFVQGFTYAPSARISLTQHTGSADQVFGWGLLLRGLDMTVKGGISSGPFVERHAANEGQVTTTTTTSTIRYISVWTCKATDTSCPQTGTPNVRLKVQVTGSPAAAKVLSWSVQR